MINGKVNIARELATNTRRWGVTIVVIYDRFVFFSVEKFFIPLLYSCLNILVQYVSANDMREIERQQEEYRENVSAHLCVCALKRRWKNE